MTRIETYFSKYSPNQLVKILDDYAIADRQVAPRDYFESSETLKEPFAYYDAKDRIFGIVVSRFFNDLLYEMAMRFSDQYRN